MALESLNTAQFDRFVEFATEKFAVGAKKSIVRVGTDDPLSGRKIEAADPKFDSVGKMRRSDIERNSNDYARSIFKDTIAKMFGGENNIPENVKKAMILDDYGKGKPLTARRIMAVKIQVDKHMAAFNQAVAAADQRAAETFEDLDVETRQKLVNAAVRRAAGDQMALDVVAARINKILPSNRGGYRSVAEVEKKVDSILANVAEIRAAAKGNQVVLGAGKNFLIGLDTKSVKKGVIAELVNFAMKMDTKAVRKLNASSDGPQIHKAVRQFLSNCNDGINKTSALKSFEGADEHDAVRDFIGELHFAKCSSSTVNKIRQAMSSEMASKVLTVYSEVDQPGYEFGEEISDGLAHHTKEQAYIAQKGINKLFFAAQARSGVPDDQIQTLESFDGQLSGGRLYSGDILDDLIDMGRVAMEKKRQELLDNCVEGTGPAADVFRTVFSRKIGPEPFDARENISRTITRNAITMLGWNIMSDCKKLALGNVKDSMFMKDLKRLANVTVGGVSLAQNLEEAQNQIAAFVTKNAKTTYAALDPKEKAKAHIVMSLISQETYKAATMGTQMALDRDGKVSAYEISYGGTNQNSGKIALNLNERGGLDLTFSYEEKASYVMGWGLDDKPISAFAGEGSKLAHSCTFTLRQKEFERLSGLDFTKFDDTNALKIQQGNENKKLDRIYEQFPKDYRLDVPEVYCDNKLNITMNEKVQKAQ